MIDLQYTYTFYQLTLFDCSDEEYNRLIDDLDYYLLKSKDNVLMIYYFIVDNILIIITKRDNKWNDRISLNILIKNALREESYLLVKSSGINGFLSDTFHKQIERADDFYKDTKKVRKELIQEFKLISRKRKIDKLKDNIHQNEGL